MQISGANIHQATIGQNTSRKNEAPLNGVTTFDLVLLANKNENTVGIRPNKGDNFRNGVTTFDLVL